MAQSPRIIADRTINLFIFLFAVTLFAFWIGTNGFPFVFHNDESYFTYVHSWYLYNGNPSSFSFLTKQMNEFVYTHNPNIPRYFHYLLMLLGIKGFTMQLLIISVLGSTGSIALLYAAFKKKFSLISVAIIGIFAIFLSPQFIVYSHNTYRVFSYLLYSLILYGTFARKPLVLGLSAFLLFQYEYAFASFVAIISLIYMLLSGWRKHTKCIFALILGAGISICLFAIQVISYMGLELVINELLSVATTKRGAAGRSLSEIFNVLPNIMNKDMRGIYEVYSLTFLCSILFLLFYKIEQSKRIDLDNTTPKSKSVDCTLQASYFVISSFLSALIVTFLLSGYCLDAYGEYRLPFTSFQEMPIIIFFSSLFIFITNIIHSPTIRKNTIGIGFIMLMISYAFLARYKYIYYMPSNTRINHGTYIDAYKEYKNKNLFTNFGGLLGFLDEPDNKNIAYGEDALNKSIAHYNYKNNTYDQSKYYICVNMTGFNCDNFLKKLEYRWQPNLLEKNKDYFLVEFTKDSKIGKLDLSISDKIWITLSIALLENTNLEFLIQEVSTVKELLTFLAKHNNEKLIQEIYFAQIDAEIILYGMGQHINILNKEVALRFIEEHQNIGREVLIAVISKNLVTSRGGDLPTIVDLKQAISHVNKILGST